MRGARPPGQTGAGHARTVSPARNRDSTSGIDSPARALTLFPQLQPDAMTMDSKQLKELAEARSVQSSSVLKAVRSQTTSRPKRTRTRSRRPVLLRNGSRRCCRRSTSSPTRTVYDSRAIGSSLPQSCTSRTPFADPYCLPGPLFELRPYTCLYHLPSPFVFMCYPPSHTLTLRVHSVVPRSTTRTSYDAHRTACPGYGNSHPCCTWTCYPQMYCKSSPPPLIASRQAH